MISVVVPIYNEEEVIIAFHQALEAALENIGEHAEIVYVNDGSTDASLSLLLNLQEQDRRVIIVELSRNFGHQAALTAGLQIARGDAVIMMDGDFQDPPQILPQLVAAWRSGAKVVIARRTRRAEKGIKGHMFSLFYKVLGILSDFPIPLNAGIFGLLDRQAADTVNDLRESNRYLPGLRSWIGFSTAVVLYERAGRLSGKPKQNLRRLFKYSMDAIFSFSFKPLRLGLISGGMLFALSLLMGIAFLIGGWLGWTPFASSSFSVILFCVLLLGAVQLISIGLLGEYIGRIYDEVRRRPLYVIHKVHQVEIVEQTVPIPTLFSKQTPAA